MTTEPRNSHPYHMHEAIWPNPRRWSGSSSATKARSTSSRTEYLSARGIPGGYRTSHTSLVGEHLMRATGRPADVRAVHSFDLAPNTGRSCAGRTASSL